MEATKSTPRPARLEVERAKERAGRILRRAAELHEVSETTLGDILGIRQQKVNARKHGERRFGVDELLRLAEHPRTRRVAQSCLDQMSAIADSAGAPVSDRSTLEEVVTITQRLGRLAAKVEASRCPASEAGEEESPTEALRIDRALEALLKAVLEMRRSRARRTA